MSLSLLTSPDNHSHSLNPIGFSLQEDDSAAVKVVVTLYVEDVYGSNSYPIAARFTEFLDASLICKFDLSELLNGKLKQAAITYGMASYVIPAQQVKRYYIIAESRDVDENVIDAYGTDGSPQHVYQGGIAFEKYLAGHFFNDWYLVKQALFTWQPNNQKVDTVMQTFAAFAFLTVPDVAKPIFKLYYTDGTDETRNGGNVNVEDPRIIIWATGYKAIVALGSISKTVWKYDVWLAFGGGLSVTATRTIYVDQRYYRNKKYFQWASTIGGMDSIMCTGNYINEYEYTGDEAIIYVPADYAEEDGQRIPIEHEEQGVFTTSTGWKTKQEIDHMRDALLSLKVFEDDGTQLVPVKIERDTIRTFESPQKLFALQFKYKTLFKNRVYTGADYDNTVRA